MELPDLDALQILYNNAPLDDFCGLSPTEAERLLYDTFGERSPLKIQPEIDDETLDRIPFFRLFEELLKILRRDKFIKLTPGGVFPKKVIVELYSYKFIPEVLIEEGLYKLHNEDYVYSIVAVRITASICSLVKKEAGKLHLTKKGEKLVASGNRYQLFLELLKVFTDKYNWAFLDGSTEMPAAQIGWGFSVYLLHRFGNEARRSSFYGEKYLQAFPHVLSFFPPERYSSPMRNFRHCYTTRTFTRFMEWFGLVTVERFGWMDVNKDPLVTVTDILDKVLYFDV
jgi:hypothetical protein